MKNILIYGLGYVGLANGLLLAEKNNVVGVDINEERIKQLQAKISPIHDEFIQNYMTTKKLNFVATNEFEELDKIDCIIIATPTNYDEKTNYFDTSSIEGILKKLNDKKVKALVVIKSTIPVGFTDLMRKEYANLQLIFSPEFLREGSALQDNLYPSRIVVGSDLNNKSLLSKSMEFIELMQNSALKENIKTYLVSSKEAECAKLFANTYLAMRVAYFNELDNFAMMQHLSAKNIIDCVSSDDRIGEFYNNPSFGYGGYCLPKDTKQLNSDFVNLQVPNALIVSISKSNSERKKLIARQVLENTNESDIIGIYKLAMKANSDNSRSSAILDIIKLLSKTRKILIYDSNVIDLKCKNCSYTNSLSELKVKSSLILSNRVDSQLDDVKHKVFTRDIFRNN